MRNGKNIYCFIFDNNSNYYRAVQQHDGTYKVSWNKSPYPVKYNPSNLLNSKIEFATNKEYFSMNRSINYPLEFIKDAAAILRYNYFLGKGVEHKLYLTIIEWNGEIGYYDLSYTGRIDFSEKDETSQDGSFTVPLIDESAWGILSRYDKVKFAIDCSEHNPKAIKVLIDGLTLEDRFTYQTVDAPIRGSFFADQLSHIIPFVLVSQDGDSSGIISKSQSYSSFSKDVYFPDQNYGFIETVYDINGVNISGQFQFKYHNSFADPFQIYDVIRIYFSTNLGKRQDIFRFGVDGLNNASRMINDGIYTANFNFNWDLSSGEKLYFALVMFNTATVTPIVTNIVVKTKTTTEPKVVYALRPLDLLQQIVNKATYEQYTINSEHFQVDNKVTITCGDAIRGVPNAQIYSSFSDFFKTFDALNWMALRVINGLLWMELATTVYPTNSTKVIDLGEVKSVKLKPAMEFYFNEIEVGSPKQDLRHPSGRFSFNSVNTFSAPILSSKTKLSIVTEYISDCFAIIFLLLDYQGQSTKDNEGDKKVFLLDITDEQSTAVENIETFENVNIDNAILEPIIKSPRSNDIINNDKPVIRGVAPVASTINIYCDNVLDGSTVADANGNWSYNITTSLSSYDGITQTGVHNIDATFTDLGGAKSSIVLTINTTVVCPTLITYPSPNDNLYNNKPLIKGIAQTGQNINIIIDSVLVHTAVADASCKWEYKSDALLNGNRTLQVDTQIIIFHVDTNVSHPLITYIGSELDGFVLLNNLPLIEGVAQPFEQVTIWLNYISYKPLGTAKADGNGNWSFQVVPVNYIDPLSGVDTILAPIKNGLDILSTSLINYTVGINVTGFKLNRPAYTSITGVIDNTVFNTRLSPKRMMKARYPLFASVLRNQPQESLYFQTPGQNAELVTVLGSETVSERSDISAGEFGNPFAILENATVQAVAKKSFIKALYDFNGGGIIKATFRGRNIFGHCIGSMKMSSIIDTEQEWKFLISTLTSFSDLLNLYNRGINIKLDNMSFYRSDRNSLHMVEYNFQPNARYQNKTIYQDWFSNRNDAWALNPDYIQKYQRSDSPFRDQIVARGFSSAILKMYRCSDAQLIDSIPYNPVATQPIPPPEIVIEAIIDLTAYPEDQYFFVLVIGTKQVMISERIYSKDYWPKTFLIEGSSTINEVGAFFSTGFKTIIRVEGLIKKMQPEVSFLNTSSDDIGNNTLLSSNIVRPVEVRFGTAYGLPDYLYLKIADASILDNLLLDNEGYVISKDEEIKKSEDINGHPLYYYTSKFYPQINKKGSTGFGETDVDSGSVILVADATAFGLPQGSLIKIDLDGQ